MEIKDQRVVREIWIGTLEIQKYQKVKQAMKLKLGGKKNRELFWRFQMEKSHGQRSLVDPKEWDMTEAI